MDIIHSVDERCFLQNYFFYVITIIMKSMIVYHCVYFDAVVESDTD